MCFEGVDVSDQMNPVEGWTWLHNSGKWHYFRDGKSICKQFMLLKHPSEGYEIGNDDSSDNCKACKRALAKEKADASS